MAEISLTLNSKSAVSGAQQLFAKLDKLENKAVKLQRKLDNFTIKAKASDLNKSLKTTPVTVYASILPKRLAGDMAAIQTKINRRGPLTARVLLRVDKNSLNQKFLKQAIPLNVQAMSDKAHATERKAEAATMAAATTAKPKTLKETVGMRSTRYNDDTMGHEWYASKAPMMQFQRPPKSTGLEDYLKQQKRDAAKLSNLSAMAAQDRQADMQRRYSWLGGQAQANNPDAQKYLEAQKLAAAQRQIASARLHAAEGLETSKPRDLAAQTRRERQRQIDMEMLKGSAPFQPQRPQTMQPIVDQRFAKQGPVWSTSELFEQERPRGRRVTRDPWSMNDLFTQDIKEVLDNNDLNQTLRDFEKSTEDFNRQQKQMRRTPEELQQGMARYFPEDTRDSAYYKGIGDIRDSENREAAYRKQMGLPETRRQSDKLDALGDSADNASKKIDAQSDATAKQTAITKQATKYDDIHKEGNLTAKEAAEMEAAAGKKSHGLSKAEMEAFGLSEDGKPLGDGGAVMTGGEAHKENLEAAKKMSKVEKGILDNRTKLLESLDKQKIRMAELTKMAKKRGDLEKVEALKRQTKTANKLQSQVSTLDPQSATAARQMSSYQKQMTALEKQTNRMVKGEKKAFSKRGGMMNSWFGKFSIYMSGIAATLFVWQELSQAISAAMTTGKAFEDTLNRVGALAGYNATQISTLEGRMRELASTMGGTPDEVGKAQEALYKLGADPARQMDQLDDVIYMVRSGLVDYAEAARIAQVDTFGLKDRLVALGKAADEGANGPLKRFKGEVSLIMKDFYKEMEPDFMVFLDDLAKWCRDEGPAVVATLKLMAESTMALIKAVQWSMEPFTNLAKIVDTKVKFESIQDKVPADLGSILKEGGPGVGNIGLNAQELERRQKVIVEIVTDPVAAAKSIDRFIAETQAKIDEFTKKAEAQKGSWIQFGDPAGEARRLQEMLDVVTRARTSAVEKIQGDIVKPGKDPTQSIDGDYVGKPEEYEAAWKEVYDKLGFMSYKYFDRLQDLSEESAIKLLKLNVPPELVREIMEIDRQKRQIMKDKPSMDGIQEYFKVTGDVSDDMKNFYLDTTKEQITNEVGQLRGADGERLTTEQQEQMVKIRMAGVKKGLEIPKIEKHQDIFDATGYQSPYLAEQLKAEANTKMNQQIGKGVDKTKAEAARDKRIREIDAQGFASRLEMLRSFFDESGVITGDYVEMEKKLLENKKQAWLESGIDSTVAEKMYQNELSALESRLVEPTISAYDQLYSETGRMTEEHYQLKIAELDRYMEVMKRYVKDEEALEKLRAERWRDIEIDRLKGSEHSWDGIRAGQLMLEKESKTHAEVVAEAYVDAAHAMDNAFKRSFFDVMEGRFENFKDIAIGALEAIRDALNEVLYQSVKNTITGGSNDWLGTIFGGLGSLAGSFSGSSAGTGGSTNVLAQTLAATGGGTTGSIALDSGGWITEPVVGVGQNSGQIYQIAENNPELVVNPRRGQTAGGGNSYAITVPVSVQGASNAQAARLQGMIEDTVRDFVREELS